MPSPPFSRKSILPQSIVGRLLGRQPKRNAFAAFNNALVDAPTIAEIPLDLVARIGAKYRVDLRRKFPSELAALYRETIDHMVADGHLGDDEVADLDHLGEVFGIDRVVRQIIHEEIASRAYRNAIASCLQDHRFTVAEKHELKNIQTALRLSDATAREVLRLEAQEAIQALASQLTADQRISPDDERALEQFAADLGARIELDPKTRDAVERMKRHWHLENAPIAELAIPVTVNLQRGEQCLLRTRCEWVERRTRTESVRFGGPAVSVRIMKGIYYRTGSYNVSRVTREVMHTVDNGELYLTSKRLIFVGPRKSSSLTMRRIIDFTPYTDGIEVQKGSSRNPIFLFADRLDEFAILLYRAMREMA